MSTLALIFIVIVILLHIYFMVLEMFLWDKPYGRKVFATKEDFATQSKALAANQGLYNGFLVAGLIWGVALGDGGFAIKIFFLSCVIVAGLFGGFTVNKRIFFVQSIPAALALVFTLMS